MKIFCALLEREIDRKKCNGGEAPACKVCEAQKAKPKKAKRPTIKQNCVFITTDHGAPVEDYIEQVKSFATADDAVLGWLVGCYEEAVKDKCLDGPKHAIEIFWRTVDEHAPDGLKGLLQRAKLPYTDHPLDDIKPLDTDQLQAVQELVKMNPAVIRLPFVQDSFVNILRNQKYGVLPSEAWNGFLHKRPGGKVLHAPDTVADLVTIAMEKGASRTEAYKKVAAGLGIAERNVRGIAGQEGAIGRPKTGK